MRFRLHRPLAALSAGLLLWLAFPDHDLWWTPPLAVALFAASLRGVRARHGAGLGLLFGLAFFLPTLSWSGVYVGVFPWAALAVLQSLYFALMGAAVAHVQRRAIAPWLGAAAWVTQEWLRSTTPFGGFSWARLAFSQADAPWAPIVAWLSAPGLTFVLALLGGFLARMLMPWCHHVLTRRQSQPAASAAGGASRVPPTHPHRARSRLVTWGSGVASLGLLALGCVITPGTTGEPLRVAAVQGNVPTAGLDFNAQRRAVLDNHVEATRRYAASIDAGRAPRPDVVVWPENSSDIDPTRNVDAKSEIGDTLAAIKTPLVVGAVLDEPRPKVSNASMLYLPGHGLSDTYVKQHPVPFGEYIPYRSFFRAFSDKVDLVRADFTQGRHTGLFTVPTSQGSAKLAPIICFEVAIDDLMRKPADDGAAAFLVQTNNATFGRTAESTQQLAISRLRALEYGRSIVHVSTVGVSALITPDGSPHERSSLFTQKVLAGTLPLRTHATPAQRLGRAPEILSTLAIVSGLVATSASRRRRRRKSSVTVER